MSSMMGQRSRHAGRAGVASQRRARLAHGFTILEIMISVLILGLGLLGLGALFPVVIRSQRQGADASFGTMAADAAKAMIQNTDYESAMLPQPPNSPPRDLWRAWRLDNTGAAPGPGGLNQPRFQRGQWLIPDTNTSTGATEIGIPGNLAYSFRMPVAQRLYPSGSPNLAPPQFVWDYAIHRIDDGINDGTLVNGVPNDSTYDAMQVAVFVRRLDIRIRVPANRNMFGAIAEGAVLPVGVDGVTGLPTNDGTGVYAKPFTVGVQFLYAPPAQTARDRLYVVAATTADEWSMVRQVGQKLVDNLGNVHTVTGSSDEGGTRYVTLESAIPSYVTQDSRLDIIEVMLTPQIPAAVSVFRIEP